MAQSENCVFCFKTIDGEGRENKHNDESSKCRETTSKFMKFLQRHLKSDIHHVNQDSTASLLIKGSDSRENTPFDIQSCTDCNQLMSNFLELYNQLKVLELKVNWAMSKLVSVMSMASKVPSRAKAFNDSLKPSGSNADDSLNATMKLKGIHDFRQDLIKKCNQHYCELLPRVTLEKQKINSVKNLRIKDDEILLLSPSPESVISLLLIAVLANNVLQLLSSLSNTNVVKQPDQTFKSSFNAPFLTEGEVERGVLENEDESNLDSEPDPCPSDTDVRSPSPCPGSNDEKVFVIVPEPTDHSSPVQENTIMSDDLDNSKRVLRARKRFNCDDCAESFATSSALLTHQQTHDDDPNSTTDEESDDEISDAQDLNNEKTEEEIIQYYANSQFKFSRRHKRDTGTMTFVPEQSKNITDTIKTEPKDDSCIQILSQCLSPTQQRLTAALLHRPKFACKFDDCGKKFVFEDQLKSHLKLHGEFMCSLCSRVEMYAPNMAKHVLTEHCTVVSNTRNFGTFVSCPMPTCASVPLPIEFHKKSYAFHYLTEHLNLDVSSIGCPICHYIRPIGDLSPHNHFQDFHGIFNMKSEDVRQCKMCPAFFCATSKLNLHLIAFHNQALTSCPDCGTTFEGINGYFYHQKECKGQNKNQLKRPEDRCSFCNKKFAHTGALFQHKKTCTFNPRGVWHNCSKCKRQFRRKENLKRHLLSHKQAIRRPKSSVNLKTCLLCGKRVSNYTTHMKWHSGPGSWKHKCSVCGNKFLFPNELRLHMERHAKALPFICKFCGVKYSRAGHLRIHYKLCSASLSTSSIPVNLQQTAREYQIPETRNGEDDQSRDDENSHLSNNLEPQINSSFAKGAINTHNQCLTDVNPSEKTEEEIIQHYATTQLEFFRKTENKKDEGEYIISHNETSTDSTLTDGTIKTLSQCLSPVQQRLAASLLHQPKFLCKINNCWERFVFEDQFESHSKLHGEFACGLCSHVETYAPKLAEHVLAKHCPVISSSKASGTFVSCSIHSCASLTSPVEYYQNNYVFHYLTEHLSLDVSAIGCPICHFTSPNGAFYRPNHFHTFHDILNKKTEDVIWCEICPAFFCSRNKFNLHMLAYHNQAPIKCLDCRKTFQSKGSFFGHRKTCKNQNRDSFQYKCSFPNCDKTFESSLGLTTHHRSCTFNPEGTWHDCTKCKKRFRLEEQLKRHLESHKRNLERLRNYSQTRNKICEVCGKSVRAARLANHMKWHAGPDAWKHLCPECGKKCVDAAKLREHMRTHTKDVSFVCQFCGVKYAHAHNLRLHVNKKHGNND